MIGFFDIYRAGIKIALDLCSGESFIPLSRSFDTAKIEKVFELCKRMKVATFAESLCHKRLLTTH